MFFFYFYIPPLKAFCGGIYTSNLFLHCFPCLLSHFSATVETDICKQNSTNIKSLGIELTHGKFFQYQNDTIYCQISHYISKFLAGILTIVKTEHLPDFMVRHFIYCPSSQFNYKKEIFSLIFIHTHKSSCYLLFVIKTTMFYYLFFIY